MKPGFFFSKDFGKKWGVQAMSSSSNKGKLGGKKQMIKPPQEKRVTNNKGFFVRVFLGEVRGGG